MTNDKQKDRLVELIGEELLNYSSWSTEMALQGTYEMPSAEEVIADKLLADGWMRPPCKVGDKVFFVNEVCDKNGDEHLDISVGEVVSFSIQSEGLWAYCRYFDGLTYWHIVEKDFGKTVFLTKEEAEAKLKEGVQG